MLTGPTSYYIQRRVVSSEFAKFPFFRKMALLLTLALFWTLKKWKKFSRNGKIIFRNSGKWKVFQCGWKRLWSKKEHTKQLGKSFTRFDFSPLYCFFKLYWQTLKKNETFLAHPKRMFFDILESGRCVSVCEKNYETNQNEIKHREGHFLDSIFGYTFRRPKCIGDFSKCIVDRKSQICSNVYENRYGATPEEKRSREGHFLVSTFRLCIGVFFPIYKCFRIPICKL